MSHALDMANHELNSNKESHRHREQELEYPSEASIPFINGMMPVTTPTIQPQSNIGTPCENSPDSFPVNDVSTEVNEQMARTARESSMTRSVRFLFNSNQS